MKNNKGQVVVEYILMIMVVVAMVTSLLGVIKTKYLGDLSKCDQAKNKKTLLCTLAKSFDPGGPKKFKYFPFHLSK